MKTVIITPEVVGPVKNGGIGTFVTHFARLLRQHDHSVSIMLTGEKSTTRSQHWQSMYTSAGIDIIDATITLDRRQNLGNWWFVQRARQAARCLPADADVVYLQDWHANGFHLVRQRRYQRQQRPLYVNVLHSSTHWLAEGMQQYPDESLTFLAQDYAERYVARYSDYVVAASQYVIDWVAQHGWQLPPADHVRALGYPFLHQPREAAPTPAARFGRIVFFGRLETRKGFELFIDTLIHLKQVMKSPGLDSIEEIVFMGKEGAQFYNSAHDGAAHLQAEIGIPVHVHDDLDTFAAQRYLAEHVTDTLVVTPSLSEVFGFVVVETSLIPGLNALYANVGGIPEVVQASGAHQLFEPYMRPFARKLDEWLTHGPRPASELAQYDWQAANQRWLDFHAEVCASAQRMQAAPPRVFPVSRAKSVDVCIAYYNHGKYLPQTLAALEHQTTDDFNVWVVNDASTDPDSVRVFDEMAQRYAGWHFLSNAQNEGLSQTRNIAVAAGSAEYVLFVDSDNVPFPQMVERFVECLRVSGDDSLTCYMQAFEGDAPPYALPLPPGQSLPVDQQADHTLYSYLPLGDSREFSLFENGFGDANFIVRREVFEALEGFKLAEPHYRYIIGEDYEFLARLVFAGYKMDVIPEFLFFYRHLNGSLQRTTSRFQSTMRVLSVYRHQLRQAQLEQLIPLVYGLHLRALELPYATQFTNPEWIANHIPWYVLRDAFRAKLRKHLPRWRR